MAIKDFKVKNGIITGGSIIPDSDEAYDLGSATKKWKDLYLSGSTLILGNIRLKDSGGVPSFEASGGGKVKIDLSAMTTADLAEHTNFPYFTNTRARSAFSTHSGSSHYDSATGVFTLPSTTDDVTEGSNLFYTDARFDTRLGTKSTTDLSEGTNLYYTTTRHNTDFDTRLGTKSTTDLSEGSNLYYTQGRFDTAFTAKSTTDLSEGSNLYYTDARADARAQAKIDALVDAAPSQLNTLNELAAALGDDSNFSGTVTASIATKLSIITDVAVTVAGGKFLLDGSSQATLHLQPGRTYKFDQSNSSNSSHPLRFSTTSDGTHNSGSQYTTNVTTVGTAGSSGAYVQIVVNHATPALYYYCGNHSGMGAGSVAATSNIWSNITSTPTTIAGYGITDAFDGAYGSLSGKPTTIAGYGITDAFDGAYGSLTGTPSTFTPSAHNQAWSTITSTPTTISGYGITDAQATLVSGTNIKTINGSSLLGSGNITISGGSGGGTDSATVSAIIVSDVDSAYVQARQSGGGSGISLSEARAGISVTTGSASGGGALSYNSSTGVFTFNPSTNSGGGSGTVDSAQTISLISDTVDSSYIQARQVDLQRDSGFITNIVDSDYVIARANINSVDASFTDFKFIADSAQTTFTGNDANGNSLSFDSSNYELFINGIRLLKSDYTANPTTNTIVLGTPAIDEDEVVINTIVANDTLALINSEYINERVRSTKALDGITTFSYNVDSGQTSFTGSDLKGNTLDYKSGDIQVYLNGILLADSDDYVATNGTSIVLNAAAPATSELVIQAYNLSLVSSFRSLPGLDVFNYTADSGQTLFQDSDVNGNVLAYHPGAIIVSMNGILLQNSVDYTATSGSSVTLLDAAESASELQITAFLASGAIDSSYVQSRQTTQDFAYNSLTGVPSTFTPAAHNQAWSTITGTPTTLAGYGITDGYTDADVLSVVDSAYVVSRQIRGLDSALADGFLMTSAETVTLIDSSYVQARSTEFDYITNIDSSYVQARVTDIDPHYVAVSSTPYTASAKERLIIDTSSASITINMPSSPTFGNEIRIIDGMGTAATNNIIISSNDKIQGSDSDLIVDVNEAGFDLVYYNATRGWILTEK